MVQCHLCPRDCVLDEGEICFCRNRANSGGKLVTLVRDQIAALETAPIEKGPLFHFLPDSRALLMGAAGCNLRCLYCQNWPTAQRNPNDQDDPLPPAEAAKLTRSEVCTILGFNFTEPSMTYEFTRDVSDAAQKEGLRTYMASGLSVQSKPLGELLKRLDAVVGSLKGIRQEFYQRIIGGDLKPVQEALVQIKKSGRWLEVAHVLTPTLNDDPKDIRALARWVKENLGPETPLHFLRFRPAYKLKNLPPTPRKTMDLAWKIAREEGLYYPYVVNLSPNPGNHTYCPGCKEIVIRRLGLRVTSTNLGPGGICLKCQTQIHGVFS
jgi:pyruvate formate lyase activating enzyme